MLRDWGQIGAPFAFHRRLPGYAPTPLRDAAGLARELGLGRVWVKQESSRFGLPAFKVLGASWATYRALAERIGHEPVGWSTFDDLAAWAAPLRPMTLAAATDGNHGRAVARMAALLGFDARIYVPDDMIPARRAAIAGEGAEVFVVHGTYDEAVARSSEDDGERCLVISDSAWPGYETVPGWVIEGYGTILQEVDDQLAAQGPRVQMSSRCRLALGRSRRPSRATTGGRGWRTRRPSWVLNRRGQRGCWPRLKRGRWSACPARTIRSWPG